MSVCVCVHHTCMCNGNITGCGEHGTKGVNFWNLSYSLVKRNEKLYPNILATEPYYMLSICKVLFHCIFMYPLNLYVHFYLYVNPMRQGYCYCSHFRNDVVKV